ncbi:MAG: hypothetical protein NWE85_03765, partial [Candidatus Bathyarchaeota archaeon]|nr:hypothetical protein [Candidatus Bathyarchaeota archaeon]
RRQSPQTYTKDLGTELYEKSVRSDRIPRDSFIARVKCAQREITSLLVVNVITSAYFEAILSTIALNLTKGLLPPNSCLT